MGVNFCLGYSWLLDQSLVDPFNYFVFYYFTTGVTKAVVGAYKRSLAKSNRFALSLTDCLFMLRNY